MSITKEVIDYLNSDWDIAGVNPEKSRVTVELSDLVQMIADFHRMKMAENVALSSVKS